MKKGFFSFCLFLGLSFTASAQEITNVSFSQDGEVSKLIIEIDKATLAERFHVTEDKQIILDVKNAKVSPKLLRGIDTSEFPGPTVYISGYKKPGTQSDVRFAIQLRDNVRSLLDVNDRLIVLSIENRFGVFSSKEASGKVSDVKEVLSDDTFGLNVPKSTSIDDILLNLTLSGPKKYVGKRISINVRKIPVVDVLNMIAETSGFNIIADQAVENLPPITLSLTNIPWDQALDTIMKIAKLSAEKSANILIVKTQDQANKEKDEEQKLAALKAKLEPLVTRVFLINYAALPDISTIVKDYLTPERASLQTDERTNSLIVKDTVESIERIKKIIETLDTQTPQILIEAKVVEANETFSKTIGLANGIRFGYDPITPLATIGEPAGPGFSFSSAPGAGGNSAQVLGMSITVFKRLLNLDFSLQMMENEQKGRIISTPKVVTQNKKPATITSSLQTSYQETLNTGVGSQQITFKPITASLNLDVTPQVTNDGAISMKVTLSKQSFLNSGPGGGAPPDLASRNVNTNVLVENGSTVVIGGLYQTSSSETVTGIPVLKDLPLIGWLFRNPDNELRTKDELIIFLTPRIMNQEEAGFTDKKTSNLDTVSEL